MREGLDGARVIHDSMDISAHPEGAIVSIRAVVRLPPGPMPSREELRENFRAGRDQLLDAIPKLIPELFYWSSRLGTEFQPSDDLRRYEIVDATQWVDFGPPSAA